MESDRSYAWPIIIIVLAVVTAGVWKLAPVVYSWIPEPARVSLRDSARRCFGSWRDASDAEAGSFNALETTDADEQDANLQAYLDLEEKIQAIVARHQRRVAEQSPYAQKAADALNALRRLQRSARTRTYESDDERRQVAYELSNLQLKVAELNQRHREWKARHAAEFPDPEKDPEVMALRRRQQALKAPIQDQPK